jgi:hypothetical protein
MNLIIGALLILSSIIVAFFVTPIAGLFIMSAFFPPSLEPISESDPIKSMSIPMLEPRVLITVKKTKHKGARKQ